MLYELRNAYKNGITLNKCDLFKKIKKKYNWMKKSDFQGLCNTYQDLNMLILISLIRKQNFLSSRKRKIRTHIVMV